jgi:hypothetical protein
MRGKAQELAKKAIYVAFSCPAGAEGEISQPMPRQNYSRLVVLSFKIAKSAPCRGVRHCASIFDLGN